MPSVAAPVYPRNLYLWTKSDDKKLLTAIKAGHTVLDASEELEREHVSVLGRLSALELFSFESGTEEWVEVMALGLGGCPLNVLLDWCNASEERLQFSEIEEMLVADFRAEFELAATLGLVVASQDVLSDLMWLVAQPDAIKAGYFKAVQAVIDRFDIPTPATLKAQVLGLVPATAPWPLVLPVKAVKKTRASSGRRRTYRKSRSYRYSKSRRSSSSSSSSRARKTYA